jgi:hypothetical protein
MARTITIEGRYCGPPGLGNGGYVCGVVAAAIPLDATGAAEVTLRRGTPVDRPLILDDTPADAALRDGDDVLVSARATTLDLAVPRPPDFARAQHAAAGYPGFAHALYPRCFGCGAARAAGDGLRVMAAPFDDTEMLAAAWVPDAAFADADGTLRDEFLWAALDCSGGWVAIGRENKRAVLLGRMTARLAAPVRAGEHCVVLAWPLDVDGRKRGAGTAVFGADGRLAASARALWIETAAAIRETAS